MTKFKGVDYSQLSESSKKTLKSRLNQLHKANLSISQACMLKSKDLANILGVKESTAKGYQRNYKQIRATKERREKTIDKAYSSHKKLGYTKKQMSDLKKELTYTAGNSFIALSDTLASLDKSLAITRTKNNDSFIEANKVIKEALNKPKKDRKAYVLKVLDKEVIKNLDKKELDVLSDYSP